LSYRFGQKPALAALSDPAFPGIYWQCVRLWHLPIVFHTGDQMPQLTLPRLTRALPFIHRPCLYVIDINISG
jgi:hypothetical protein